MVPIVMVPIVMVPIVMVPTLSRHHRPVVVPIPGPGLEQSATSLSRHTLQGRPSFELDATQARRSTLLAMSGTRTLPFLKNASFPAAAATPPKPSVRVVGPHRN